MAISRLEMVFTHEELNRISVQERQIGKARIVADVHGMTCREARRFINNIINLVRISFQLIVIHGYNRGTAIKDMLANDFNNNHIYGRFPDPRNQGVTHLLIAA